ncbi:cytochrome P450 2D9-like, partial [Psammomys obesus]|uniref:cytochrome P450 2D9-like n=1 Tax=Psammomys obesus TaxID=48139 RepID=UPI0024530BBD
MAWTPLVVVNGLKAVWEVLVTCGEDTADRPPAPIFEYLGWRHKSLGVIFAPYGPEWQEQRRFSVSTLRNFGLGRKSLEQWVTEEAGHLCDAFSDQAGSPFNPKTLLNKSVCNVIASLIFARRFEYGDPFLTRMLKLLEECLREVSGFIPESLKAVTRRRQVMAQVHCEGGSGDWSTWTLSIASPEGQPNAERALNAFPMLLRVPGLADKALQGQKTFMSMVDKLLTENRITWDPAQPPRNLTDAFLAEVEKAKGNPESSFNDENLRRVVADLFMAGMVTTSTTLSWALLLMILHPDVQRRVQQEIDEVIGQVRRPEMADQARMPYTNAVVHEVQRFADISPVHLPRLASRDIEVQGFRIPKGTMVMLNLSSVLKDETVWEKPLQFHPEHFLDAQGHFVKHEAF